MATLLSHPLTHQLRLQSRAPHLDVGPENYLNASLHLQLYSRSLMNTHCIPDQIRILRGTILGGLITRLLQPALDEQCGKFLGGGSANRQEQPNKASHRMTDQPRNQNPTPVQAPVIGGYERCAKYTDMKKSCLILFAAISIQACSLAGDPERLTTKYFKGVELYSWRDTASDEFRGLFLGR